MALYVPQINEEYQNEGITSSDDSNDEHVDNVDIEGETTVCKNDENQNGSKYFPFTAKEKSYGIDLDLFGRFPPQKIPKHFKKPIYHYHSEPSINDLKYIWNELKCKQLRVQHLDSEYSLMQFDGDEHHPSSYNLICRRYIWPINFQNAMYERIPFQYNLEDINKYFKWCIILIMGGKFSIAIYHGNTCMYHKCERAYVVRSKHCGKREVNFLSNKTRCNSKSAGSQKRAWNELHLKQKVQAILSLLQDEIMDCNRIFIHSPSSCNKSVLFGEKKEQMYLYPDNEELSRQRLKQVRIMNTNKKVNKYRLSRKDPRIMSVPITIYQATFAENQRVNYWLSTCWLNDGN